MPRFFSVWCRSPSLKPLLTGLVGYIQAHIHLSSRPAHQKKFKGRRLCGKCGMPSDYFEQRGEGAAYWFICKACIKNENKDQTKAAV